MEKKLENKQSQPPTVLKFNKDAMILMEGEDNPGYIFIVKSGTLKIHSKIVFKDRSMNVYSPGDVFGFVSSILKQKHGQNITAETDCEVLRLTVVQFLLFIRERSGAFIKFLSYYTEKLRLLMDENRNPYDSPVIIEPSPEQLIYDAKLYKQLELSNKACYALSKYLTCEFSSKKRPDKIEEAKKLLESYDPEYKLPEVSSTDSANQITIEDGQILFIQNEPDDYLYVIESGGILVTKLSGGKEVIVDTIFKGEIIGEMALLNKKVRIATASAKGNTTLKRFKLDDLLAHAADDVLIKIFYILAKRFNLANQRIFIRKVEDQNIKFYLQLNLLLQEKLKPGTSKKEEFTIDYTLDQVANMLGITNIEKDKISDLTKDKNVKFNDTNIVITNAEDFEHRVGIMKNRYNRMIKDMII